jgi:hypothetical protein
MEEINYQIEHFTYDLFVIPDPMLSQEGCSERCEYLTERLTEVPMLVSNFKVDENFIQGGISFLDQEITPASPGKPNKQHSMLLIGMRRDEKYGWVFLLQNGG